MTTVLTDLTLAATDTERADLRLLARDLTLAGSGAVDDEAWQAQARLAGSRLPVRLRERIRAYRHDAGADGTLTITNLPIPSDSLPPTPSTPDSVERAATIASSVAVLLGQQLGEVIAYRDEKLGALVQNVVPVPSLATSQSNGGSVPLEFHTENAFHPHRPDYLGLLCLRPAHEGQIGTQIASIRRAYPLLAEEAMKVLREDRFVTVAPPSFRSAARAEPRPVLTGSADDPDICVDFHATSAVDGEAEAALDLLRETLNAVRTDLVLSPGDMVFLDNRLVVHGRVAFSPRYDGTDRWLHRVFVHLDNRRSRICRQDNGPVLS